MATSFVDTSLQRGHGFGLDNLPWGCFSRVEGPPSVGVKVGGHVVDVTALQRAGYLQDLPGPGPSSTALRSCFQHGRLNEFMAMGRPAWRAARTGLQRLLDAREGELRDNAALRAAVLVPEVDVVMELPAAIGDYTDFYASRQHATNVGTMFRGAAAALNPNWGQVLPSGGGAAATAPVFAPSSAIDYELEVAAVVGPGNALGESIPVARGWEHVFGLVLMNDWSARDIQKWEYVPLGPFNGKNWATQISPWVVTLEALEPYRCPAPPQDEPQVLPYLQEAERYTYDVQLAVDIAGGGDSPSAPATATHSSLRNLYWTFPQMIAHHTAGGCNLRPGDLLGSGTISGDEPGSRGCLLELSWGATQDVVLQPGERHLPRAASRQQQQCNEGSAAAEAAAAGSLEAVRRRYLLDGDSVVVRGWCEGAGGSYSGGESFVDFGECRGTLLPSR